MKKFYAATLTIIFVISASLLFYGIFLNSISERHIASVMERRVVSLRGVRAEFRDIRPEITLEIAGLSTKSMTDVITQIDGTVKKLYVVKGQKVKVGEKLCEIENDELPLQISRVLTDIARAEASYVKDKNTFERNKRLYLKNAISQSDLEASEQQMKASSAELNAAKIVRAQLEQQSKYQTITAPVDGKILLVYQNIASHVFKGTPMMNVADFSSMECSDLLEEDKLQNLMPVDDSYECVFETEQFMERTFEAPLEKGVNDSTSFDVKILDITPSLSQKTLFRNVRWDVKNPDGIIEAGMYTDVIIRKKKPVRVLAVPADAVIRNMETPALYIMDKDGTLAVKAVETGFYDNKYIEIRSGLMEGDVIITSETEGLSLGTKIEVQPALQKVIPNE